MANSQTPRRSASVVVSEPLETRRLLSGYTFSQVVSFPTSGLNTPIGALAVDSAGNIYGTAREGGNGSGGIFEVAAGSHTPTTLALFPANTNINLWGLIIDSNGTLYGVNGLGGANSNGFVFALPKGSSDIQTLASFSSSTTGNDPEGRLMFDAEGDLVGTTADGGPTGGGTIWELAPAGGTINVLAAFPVDHSSQIPILVEAQGDLIHDSAGNIFGTGSGDPAFGSEGSIFELPHGSSTIVTLASFNGTNGQNPQGGLVMNANGDLFGTAAGGIFAANTGTVFELPNGSQSISVLAPIGGATGTHPIGPLVLDAAGNLFGSASEGGDTSSDASGAGTVFEVPVGASTLTVLKTFNHTDGDRPGGGLLLDANGNLFGATQFGGNASNTAGGIVFELSPGGGGGGAASSLNATLSGKVPQSVQPGQKANLSQSVTIVDSGMTAVNGSISTTLYLNTTSSLDGNQIPLKIIAKSVKLKHLGHFTVPFKISSLPASIPDGTYFVVAGVTDPNNAVTTVASASTIAIAAGHIDLSASALTTRGAKAGKKTPISFTLTNAGNILAAGLLPVAFQTSPDAIVGDAAPLITINKKISVKPGKPVKITLPVVLPAGSYAIVVVLDPANTLNDADPSNNTLVGPIITVS